MKKIFILLLVLVSSFYFIFSLRTHLFFSLDDFTILAYFKTHSFRTMVEQFLLYGDPWGFHKIIGYLNLRLLYLSFGTNPLPYIINNQVLQTANVVILFLIISKLTQDNPKAFILALIFNSLYLYYFSNVHEYLVTFFCLLTIRFYQDSHFRLALSFFFLALFSKEIALSLPLFLLAVTLFQKKSLKPLFPFFSLATLYFAYQLAFVVAREPVNANHPYAIVTNPQTIWQNLHFYFPPAWFFVIIVPSVLIAHRRVYLLLLPALLALFPALVLKNRQETYYLYLPLAYLCLYLAAILPRFHLKTSVVFGAIILLLGGRKLLPPLARQNFINWQKHSVEQVVDLVAKKLESEPNTSTIIIDKSKLERDAVLMLESGTLDLFLPISLAARYHSTKVVY